MTRSADILRRAALPMILLAGLAAACAPVGPAVPDSVADDGVVLVPSYPDYQKTY